MRNIILNTCIAAALFGLGGCSYLASLGLVAPTSPAAVAQDATILCQDAGTGVVTARVIDPSLVNHNGVDIAAAGKVCAAFDAVPPPGTGPYGVPVTLVPHTSVEAAGS
jgi:hypothetical protein